MPCVICFQPKRWYQDIRVLKCNHKFHLDCIKKWSHINPKCPLCNTTILPQKYVSLAYLYKSYKGQLSIEEVLLDAGIE